MKGMVVAGARPNFMKVAPIMAEFQRRTDLKDLKVLLVHTGQHYDSQMSDAFFEDLRIPPPDVNLGVGSGTHAEQTARVMVAFEELCTVERPDWVTVVGDVNSTLACGITTKKLGIALAHVEAGLRSGDRTMPEEINRLCTDAIADLLFTTDRIANKNLRNEGISEDRIHFVGNTMIDTLLRHIEHARSLALPDGLTDGEFAVLTLHRPGNVDNRETLTGICSVMQDISRQIPVVFPMHPRTRKRLKEFNLFELLGNDTRIKVMEPLSYLPFLGLVAHSRMVLTDSGGIQEETTVLKIPCITMRPHTERPITCEVGTNMLVGTDPDKVRATTLSVLNRGLQTSSIPEKWDGHAAARIVEVLSSVAPRI
jgi:UDP-N-acetylglucosamine 2-epimerase (non-hydrolysing)